MKKNGALTIFLELIVIIGNLIIGGAILVCHFMNQPITRTLVGLIILALGLIGLLEYFTFKVEVKLKSTQNIFGYLAAIVIALLFIIFKLEPNVVCIIWGSFSISLAVVKIATSFLNFLKQPLLHSVRILTSITLIVFSIIFLVKITDFLVTYFIFYGIILLIEAFILLIEFIIHRYQR